MQFTAGKKDLQWEQTLWIPLTGGLFLLAAAATDMTIYLQACKNLEQEHTHMHKHLYSEGTPTVQNVNIKMSQGHI